MAPAVMTIRYPRLTLILLVFVSLAPARATPGTTTAQGANSAAYRASELVRRWALIVNETFESSRAFSTDEFEDKVTDLIDQFLSAGAVRAVQDRASEPQLKTADGAVKRLAAAMVEAGNRQSDGSTQVTETSFETGRKKLCPQYPFCS